MDPAGRRSFLLLEIQTQRGEHRAVAIRCKGDRIPRHAGPQHTCSRLIGTIGNKRIGENTGAATNPKYGQSILLRRHLEHGMPPEESEHDPPFRRASRPPPANRGIASAIGTRTPFPGPE